MTIEQVFLICAIFFLSVVTASVVGYFATRKPTPQQLLSRLERDLPDLQGEFVQAGARRGLPRGHAWVGCDWGRERRLAYDRTAEEMVALVEIALHLEPALGAQPEPASAVFHFSAGRWETLGKVVFHLRPSQVLEQQQDQFGPPSEADAADRG